MDRDHEVNRGNPNSPKSPHAASILLAAHATRLRYLVARSDVTGYHVCAQQTRSLRRGGQDVVANAPHKHPRKHHENFV